MGVERFRRRDVRVVRWVGFMIGMIVGEGGVLWLFMRIV